MDKRPENRSDFNEEINPQEISDRSKEKTFQSAEQIYTISGIPTGSFHSRFKLWIRAASIAVLLAFVPEQASWAFNYNPLVIWGNKTQNTITINPNATEEEATSAHIASGVLNLLNQIAYKENSSIKLELPDHSALTKRNLALDTKVFFTKNRIRQISEWLQKPEIHPLNCGVYALFDILKSRKIDVALEEVSVAAIIIDLVSDITRPGDPTLKTSLFSINKLTEAYGLDYQAVKISSQDISKLTPPFIASLKEEHFVTVFKVDNGKIFYNDIGAAKTLSVEDFVSQFTGFILVAGLETMQADYEKVPDSMQAFVWGDKWNDRSKDLPGLVSSKAMWTTIAIRVA